MLKSSSLLFSLFFLDLWPNLGLNNGHAWARMGQHVTILTSLHSCHTKNIPSDSSKSDEPNSRYIENGIFWDQIWPNLGLNERHAWVRMGQHVTKLIRANPWKVDK